MHASGLVRTALRRVFAPAAAPAPAIVGPVPRTVLGAQGCSDERIAAADSSQSRAYPVDSLALALMQDELFNCRWHGPPEIILAEARPRFSAAAHCRSRSFSLPVSPSLSSSPRFVCCRWNCAHPRMPALRILRAVLPRPPACSRRQNALLPNNTTVATIPQSRRLAARAPTSTLLSHGFIAGLVSMPERTPHLRHDKGRSTHPTPILTWRCTWTTAKVAEGL
ncbi:hypothetical protein BDV95DRAFT_651142 [Massariosphaeria phaeospora]|uniref:Uncharacterized protein n=1 Tax=Massariosphaeria phaeospora TaxID=100035 RepID=A0A7C8IDR4_9PLEO|nr:hypothetical protein BDV95DRAFT_651142 [Massariosphaeria phaeospora]